MVDEARPYEDFGDENDEWPQEMIDAAADVLDQLRAAGMTDEEIVAHLEALMMQFDAEEELQGLSVEELFDRLADLGLEMTQEEFEEHVKRNTLVEEMLDEMCAESGVELDDDSYDLAVAVCLILWDELLPEEYDEDLFVQSIQYGEIAKSDGERAFVLEAWSTAWYALKRNMRVRGCETLDEYAANFENGELLGRWLEEFEEFLENDAEGLEGADELIADYDRECARLFGVEE